MTGGQFIDYIQNLSKRAAMKAGRFRYARIVAGKGVLEGLDKIDDDKRWRKDGCDRGSDPYDCCCAKGFEMDETDEPMPGEAIGQKDKHLYHYEYSCDVPTWEDVCPHHDPYWWVWEPSTPHRKPLFIAPPDPPVQNRILLKDPTLATRLK